MIWHEGTDAAWMTVGGVQVVLIKKRNDGRNFPYYFKRSLPFIRYTGGFGSLASAKKHAEKKTKLFAKNILNDLS